MLIDAHVHVYEEPMPRLGRADVTIEGVVATMDRLGVGGSILVSAWGAYGDDPSYAVQGHLRHPDRFRLVAPFDVRSADLEEKLERWVATPGAVGLRLVGLGDQDISLAGAGAHRVAQTAARTGLVLCLLSPGRPHVVDGLVRAYPEARFVLDHLGLGMGDEQDPLADLPDVLALARYGNLALKVANIARLSRSGPPFADVWDPMSRLIDAFGPDRCMWGTDWTVTQQLASVDELVDVLRRDLPLTPRERDAVMGGTAARVFRWR
ncbi:MAG: amidohydrolase family protein [Microbacterium sp.]